MIYFKNKTTGEVFAYETTDERDKYGASDLVEMTADEVNAHLNPTPTAEQLASNERIWRDRQIAVTDYLAMPDYPLTDTERTDLYTYRQALRDWPASTAFPTADGRPQPPEWLSAIITA